MSDFPFLHLLLVVLIAALFLLMAVRAFRSASTLDYLLGAAQCGGLLMLLSNYRQYALYFLLLTAAAYLLSQIMTGARPVSRLLPIAGAAVIVLFLLI